MTDKTGAPRTAYEIAMERLKKRDEEEGVEHRPLSDAQKAAIAEIRNFYEAKLAQAEVLHQSQMLTMFDPAARETAEQEYRREREHLRSERDSKIEKARSAGG
jgi:demethoxyubiquinone hydroxylase (CLK1/Coq7/Cat5 family)